MSWSPPLTTIGLSTSEAGNGMSSSSQKEAIPNNNIIYIIRILLHSKNIIHSNSGSRFQESGPILTAPGTLTAAAPGAAGGSWGYAPDPVRENKNKKRRVQQL